MASKLGAGKEVLSFCTKCKLALAHVIIAMKDDKNIHKVQCKTCNSLHAYKDPSASSKKRSTRASAKEKAVQMSVSDIWMKEMSNTKKKSIKYTIGTKFNLGDIIDHTKFGPGIVHSIVDNNKIEVVFRHEMKTLIHNKK